MLQFRKRPYLAFVKRTAGASSLGLTSVPRVPILPSFRGYLASRNVYHTKKDLVSQGGHEPHTNEKASRKDAYRRKAENARRATRRRLSNELFPKGSCPVRKTKQASLRTIHEDMVETHFGLETITSAKFAVDALARFANIDVPDRMLREIEGILLLFTSLSQQSSSMGVVSSILLWAQGRTSKSLLQSLKTFVEETLFDQQSSETPAWLECMRDMHQNWQLCRNNRAFAQVSKLLGCLVMLGLCDASSVTFSLGQFKVLAPELNEKHMGAFDVADAIFETVVFFAEGAYLCFQTGSIRPMLLNDRSAVELDTEYAQVCAWFELVKNGNLKKFADMSDQEFEKRLNRLSTNLINLSHTLKGPEKKFVVDKYQNILKIQNDYVTLKIAGGVRHCPWAIGAFGPSNQGKTTILDQLVDALLTSQGMPIGKEYRCTYNPSDKFMSNWTSEKLVLNFNDVANGKSAFVEQPPTGPIINVINNEMFYAPKAEIDAKGKCFVEPWIVTASTNKKDLDAGLYSNCPYSIQRRLYMMTVKAKERFQLSEDGVFCGLDSAKVREHYTDANGVYVPPMFDDIWVVTVERAIQPGDLRLVAGYAPVKYKGQPLENVSMAVVIQWAIEDFAKHKKNQEALLDSMRTRQSTMQRCPHEGCIHLAGNCPNHVYEKHLGRETVASMWKLWYASEGIRKEATGVYDAADKAVAEQIYYRGMDFLTKWDWIKVVPAPILEHTDALAYIRWFYKDRLERNYNAEVLQIGINAIALLCICFAFLPAPLAWTLLPIILVRSLFRLRGLVEYVEERLYCDLKERNMGVAPIIKRYRDDYAKVICMASFGIAALYGMARAYRAYYSEGTQGSLEPKTPVDVQQRDSEVNVWTSVVQRDLPISDVSKRMAPSHVANCVEKATMYGSIHLGDQTGMVNSMFISSNVCLMADHYFNDFGETLDCTFRKKNPEASGGKFATRLSRKASYLIPGTDIRVCYSSTGGSFKDLVNFFPTGDMPSVPFQLYWRQKDGSMLQAKGVTEPGIVTTYRSFPGGMYRNLTMNTFQGLCGAPIISETNGSVILGIHLGGTAGTPKGCYGSITQLDLYRAYEHLRTIEGVIISGSAGNFDSKPFGVQILKPDPLHPKSPVNYLPPDSQIEYFGSCVGRSITKTSVEETPISVHITDICGVPNIYHGPKLNPEWYGWQECLSNMAVPALPYDYEILEVAVRDYKEPLIEVFRSDMWSSARPLTEQENLWGVPGVKFLDPIKLDTAVGYPLTGTKREYIVEVMHPDEEWPTERKLEEALMLEITRMEECYRKGERAYPIAKACKKDEILAKWKCRIFYGNAIGLTYLIRKYYLPILRVLQMNPLKSECAVGINSHGPEWDEFYRHATQFGMDRLFGGDYGNYDQKLPAQLIFASLRILIDFAKECEYSVEDIKIMEAMTGDIVFAYIAFNGDLIGLTEGTHISGNSLTVIINGICGSLNLRCFFYAMNRPISYESRLEFRKYVALSTYGDDNIGSVSKDIDNFTIKGCSKFLQETGQIYTMPDKESELLDFLPEEDFEFLKRKSVYHPKLGVYVGALVDKSIYKSLHCFMREKNCVNTKETACALNIDGALREWFNHGEDKYEQQRLLMKEVASRAGIAHICTGLDATYDERVATWVSNYVKTPS